MVTTTHGQHLVMGFSSPGDADDGPGQTISASIHSFAAARAAKWASAEDAARFRKGTTIPLWLRGSCSGFQTSTLAENFVSTAVSVMRIFQPRYTCSDVLALESIMPERLHLDYQGQN
jgi:hypothetical protein